MNKTCKYLFAAFSALALFNVANAQSWHTVGAAGFAYPNSTYSFGFAIGLNDTPFVAYSDMNNLGGATVKKYDGSNWVTVGSPGFSTTVASNLSFAINNAGTPYVLFADYGLSGRVTVMKYTGGNWTTVGTEGFSDSSNIVATKIAIDNNDIPYIAFITVNDNIVVMKYNGSNWVYVGNSHYGHHMQLAINHVTNAPCLVYDDQDFVPTALQYTTSWIPIGSVAAINTTHWAHIVDMVIDNTGVPFVSYANENNGNEASVLEYTGGAWSSVGTTSFSHNYTTYHIAVDDGNTPYISYADELNGWKATVVKFDGTNWVHVGAAGFTAGASDPLIALNGNGVPYVAYMDSSVNGKITVQSFSSVSAINKLENGSAPISIYPNPSDGTFICNLSSLNKESASITIVNVVGAVVKGMQAPTNANVHIQLNEPPGVYFLTAVTAEERQTVKIVVR